MLLDDSGSVFLKHNGDIKLNSCYDLIPTMSPLIYMRHYAKYFALSLLPQTSEVNIDTVLPQFPDGDAEV